MRIFKLDMGLRWIRGFYINDIEVIYRRMVGIARKPRDWDGSIMGISKRNDNDEIEWEIGEISV